MKSPRRRESRPAPAEFEFQRPHRRVDDAVDSEQGQPEWVVQQEICLKILNTQVGLLEVTSSLTQE
jgi:hypothetical protein